ncbi:hypothetical protein BpHYR1_037665 [Brachionus plicatilis]|uniref:Uncharacterized protein n=1 Tax=Brachionus plicatilis TaxID=10195 RepID=A0A3M7P5J4_BRAPC|nr:hypothetical protein BpHYR1_037665 [Brachionus plicatilis]
MRNFALNANDIFLFLLLRENEKFCSYRIPTLTDELSSSIFLDIRPKFFGLFSTELDSIVFNLFISTGASVSVCDNSSSLAGSMEDEVDDEDKDEDEFRDK